jgi:NADPH2:quinone reductase
MINVKNVKNSFIKCCKFSFLTNIHSDITKKIQEISFVKSFIATDFSPEKISIIKEAFDLNNQSLDKNEAVILTDSCPINPLDLQKISGKLKELKLPFVLGSECSGIIIKTKENNTHLIGKKVAASIPSGSYKSINITRDSDMIIFPDDYEMSDLSCAFINPLTSLGLISIAKQLSPKTLVNTGAASALGKMIIKLCKFYNINCLNIVRSERSYKELKIEFGEDIIVMNSSDENFSDNFKRIANSLSATLCLDCVGGNLTGNMLNAMPNNSTLVVYSSLESEVLQDVNGIFLRRKNQIIRGFILYHWWGSLTDDERENYKKFVVENFPKIFHTKIGIIKSMDDVKECFKYYQNNLSGGKSILKF